jgi:NAD(P)-dependent dehydrogenase (short-subunit alcohol dehydrogenase family)
MASMGKTVLITGAASELGESLAEGLAGAGHRVFASMREPFGRNRAAANRLWAQGIDVIPLDVTDGDSIASGIEAARRKAGHIDVVVNNARIAIIGAVEAVSPSQLQEVLNTNVVGMVRTAQAILPAMRRAGAGLIVNIGSILGRVTLPYFGVHSAGDFALEALTDSLRYELAPYGVDVVLVQQSISPGSAKMLAIGGGQPAIPPAELSATLQRVSAALEMVRVPSPQGVCGAVRLLLEQPAGSRPYRLVVGEALGADQLNRLAEKVQREALRAVSTGILGGREHLQGSDA